MLFVWFICPVFVPFSCPHSRIRLVTCQESKYEYMKGCCSCPTAAVVLFHVVNFTAFTFFISRCLTCCRLWILTSSLSFCYLYLFTLTPLHFFFFFFFTANYLVCPRPGQRGGEEVVSPLVDASSCSHTSHILYNLYQFAVCKL